MSATTEYTHQEPPLVLREQLGNAAPAGSGARPLQPWLTKRGRIVRSVTRAALIWCTGFLVFAANEHSLVAAAALAAVAAFVWSTLCQRAADAARVKRVAFGTAATTVAGILAGFVVLSAISFIAPQLGLQPQGLALIAFLSVVLVTAGERVLDRAIPNPQPAADRRRRPPRRGASRVNRDGPEVELRHRRPDRRRARRRPGRRRPDAGQDRRPGRRGQARAARPDRRRRHADRAPRCSPSCSRSPTRASRSSDCRSSTSRPSGGCRSAT